MSTNLDALIVVTTRTKAAAMTTMNSQLEAPVELPIPTRGSRARHNQVLDEATIEFNATGVNLSSMADIAARIGISRAAMYTYVADREDLVFQCCQRTLILLTRYLDEAALDSSNAVGTLAAFIDRAFDHKGPPLAARAEIATVNPAHRETIQALYLPLVTRLADILATGARNGELRVCDYQIVARIIVGLINWAPLTYRFIGGVSEGNARRAAATVRSIVLDGLAQDRKSSPRFRPIDLTPLQFKTRDAFDRDAINAARLEAVLSTASRLFNRQGFHVTSLQEIMVSIGTTKRTLYRHLADKQALAAACYDRAFRLYFYLRDRSVEYQGTRLQAIAAVVHGMASAYLRDDLVPLSPPVCYMALESEHREKFNTNHFDLAKSYAQLINAGIAEGSIAAIDPEARIVLMPGIFGLLVRSDLPEDAAYRELVAQEITALFCIGVRAA
jgi:AcrR family transcriptional regulator